MPPVAREQRERGPLQVVRRVDTHIVPTPRRVQGCRERGVDTGSGARQSNEGVERRDHGQGAAGRAVQVRQGSHRARRVEGADHADDVWILGVGTRVRRALRLVEEPRARDRVVARLVRDLKATRPGTRARGGRTRLRPPSETSSPGHLPGGVRVEHASAQRKGLPRHRARTRDLRPGHGPHHADARHRCRAVRRRAARGVLRRARRDRLRGARRRLTLASRAGTGVGAALTRP